ncbi:MAG: ABC transporter permease [Longimicrobiales bacterium]|nr:ABC transporter permease [Longimicrobiales bacterium]
MTRWISWLIRLHPEAFRDRFGAEVEAHAREDLERARARGSTHALRCGLALFIDLVASAIAEHAHPAWSGSHTVHSRGRGRGMGIANWIREVRLAGRSLARSPGFALVALGTLTLTLGANAAIFAVVDAVLLEPLPFEEPDELIVITGTSPGSDLPPEFGLSGEFLLDFREEASSLTGIAAFNSFTATFRTSERVERVRMSVPDIALFDVLGVAPALGRLPDPERDEVVISHEMWTTWFGEDPSVIGRSYPVMDGRAREIVGVMGEGFGFPNDEVLVWIPGTLSAEGVTPGNFGLNLVARVAEGVEPDAVVAELQRIGRRAPEKWGGSARYAEAVANLTPIVRPLEDTLVSEARAPLWLMMLAVGVVLVIASANIANLFAVRAEGRGRDLAVRRAIGADRYHLVRSQFAEAIVLAALAGIASVGLAWLAIPALVAVIPEGLPRLAQIALTPGVVAFTLALAGLTALACGLAPAWRASRPDLARLRDGSRGATRRRSLVRDGLVIGQTALALVLLTASGLLIRSFQELYAVDPGYDVSDVFTFQFAPEEAHLTDGPTWAAFHVEMMDRLRALPGVESVGIVENVPLDEGPEDVRVVTGERPDPEGAALASLTVAGGDYFATMGIEVEAGRGFTRDDAFTPGNAIVSRTLADRLWPGEDPIGRRVETATLPGWHTIVGVVEDVLQFDLRDEPEPLLYYPLVFENTEVALTSPGYVVRTARAETIAPEIRALVTEVTPSAPMYRAYTMQGLLDRTTASLSFTMITLAIAAGLSLLLGSIGLFGVLSYIVAQRSREIGIRIALGAEASRVQRMVITQGARVVAFGVALGTVVALLATRLMEGLLYGVGAFDPVSFSSAPPSSCSASASSRAGCPRGGRPQSTRSSPCGSSDRAARAPQYR